LELVTEDMITEQIPCGPGIDRHISALRDYEDAGVGEVYVQQVGPNQDDFFAAYREHVLPSSQSGEQLAHASSR
jgi:hypothetical protein